MTSVTIKRPISVEREGDGFEIRNVTIPQDPTQRKLLAEQIYDGFDAIQRQKVAEILAKNTVGKEPLLALQDIAGFESESEREKGIQFVDQFLSGAFR